MMSSVVLAISVQCPIYARNKVMPGNAQTAHGNGRCIISQQFAQVRTQIKDSLAGVLFFTEPWTPRDSDTCTYTRHRADDGCAQGVLCRQFAA